MSLKKEDGFWLCMWLFGRELGDLGSVSKWVLDMFACLLVCVTENLKYIY